MGLLDRLKKFLGLEKEVPRITIHVENPYTPTVLDRPCEWLQKPQGNNGNYLFISNNAQNRMENFVNWGEVTRFNSVERGGILLGKAYRCGNEIYNSVEDVLLANATGTAAFVEFTPQNWEEMQGQLTRLNIGRSDDDKLNIVGWWHTHPNELDVFMSGTDRETQEKNFSQDWQASVVMNPHPPSLERGVRFGLKRSAFFGLEAIRGNIVHRDFQDIIREQRQTDIAQSEVSPRIEIHPKIRLLITNPKPKIEIQGRTDTNSPSFDDDCR